MMDEMMEMTTNTKCAVSSLLCVCSTAIEDLILSPPSTLDATYYPTLLQST